MQGRLADPLQDDRIGRWRVTQHSLKPRQRHVGVVPGPLRHADGALAAGAAQIAAGGDLILQAAQPPGDGKQVSVRHAAQNAAKR